MVNGLLVAWLRVPSIVATLGTLSIYRGFAFLVAGGKQVTLTELPPGYTDPARATILGIVPLFLVIAVVVVIVAAVVLRQTRSAVVYAVGSNPEAAAFLGIRLAVVTFAVFSAVRPARRPRRDPVGDAVRDDQRDRRDRGHAPGHRGRRRRRGQHLRRIGTVVGAGLGAMFLPSSPTRSSS